jgi:alpha-aminoadipate carrier protein LysW
MCSVPAKEQTNKRTNEQGRPTTDYRPLLIVHRSSFIINQEEHPMTANCPECDATITLGADIVEGEIVVCPDCAAELEVTGLNPLELSLAPEVGEDWGE